MEINWVKKENKQLIQAILSLENTSETQAFLRDLLTVGEIEEFAKRLEAARMLSQNVQYTAIVEKTGLSSTTVARISKWLKGSFGGYRLILSRLSATRSTTLTTSHHHNPPKLRKGLSLSS